MLKLLDSTKEKAQQFKWTDTLQLWVLLISSHYFSPITVMADW